MDSFVDNEDTREPWQIAIDEEIDKKEKRKKEEEEAKRISDEQKRLQEYQRKVQELGKKFKCHCCGTPSRVPKTKIFNDDYSSEKVTFWSSPGDLERCLHCGQFICKSCLYKGICKTCALKMVSKH